jgi:hypothetical protein
MSKHAMWKGNEIHPGDKLLVEVEFVKRDVHNGGADDRDLTVFVSVPDGCAGFSTFPMDTGRIRKLLPLEISVGCDVVFSDLNSNARYKVVHLHEDWVMVKGSTNSRPIVTHRSNLIPVRFKS